MAYDFNGTSQYLNTSFAPASGTPMTIAAWVNPDNRPGVAVCIYSTVDSDRFQIQFDATVTAATSVNDGIIFGSASSASVSINQWSHICGIFNSSNNRVSYTNGTAGSANTTNVAPVSSFNSILIGAQQSAGSKVTYLDGRIAEVGIWNAALTAAEIASLAKGMTCDKVRPQSLVFYAPLVRDLIDQKGGLAITNNNSATVANHPRVYA
jgi:hypothetical protein